MYKIYSQAWLKRPLNGWFNFIKTTQKFCISCPGHVWNAVLVWKKQASFSNVSVYLDIGQEVEESLRVIVAPQIYDSAEVGHRVPVPLATVVAVAFLLQMRHV